MHQQMERHHLRLFCFFVCRWTKMSRTIQYDTQASSLDESFAFFNLWKRKKVEGYMTERRKRFNRQEADGGRQICGRILSASSSDIRPCQTTEKGHNYRIIKHRKLFRKEKKRKEKEQTTFAVAAEKDFPILHRHTRPARPSEFIIHTI